MTVSNYLLNLIRATVRNEMPMEKPEDISWQDLFDLAEFHQVQELAFFSIQKLENKPTGEDLKLWEDDHKRNDIIDVLQREEAKLIMDEASKKNIGILPLKGYFFKDLYPATILREMGDLDFLIEPGKIDEMRSIMKEMSYREDDVGMEETHDVYKKDPYLVVENHRRLLPPTEENHWFTDDIWDRLESNPDKPCVKSMTWTDFYLFHLLHFEKHFSMGGSGIRSIIDHYYARKELEDKIDWDFVKDILPKMNYVEFEKMSTDLANFLFEDGEITDELGKKLSFIMDSGSYGTMTEFQKSEFEKYKEEQGIKTKKGFFFRRMFMERERMEYVYPSLKKHRWLLPFCWIHRLFKAIFTNRKRVKSEIRGIKDIK